MKDNNVVIVTVDFESNYAKDLIGFMEIDNNKSFKGWLTHLTMTEFLEVQDIFDNDLPEKFSIVYARLTGELPDHKSVLMYGAYLVAREFSSNDVAEIGLYRKGYTELVSRDNGIWIFKPSKKGEEYINQTFSK